MDSAFLGPSLQYFKTNKNCCEVTVNFHVKLPQKKIIAAISVTKSLVLCGLKIL